MNRKTIHRLLITKVDFLMFILIFIQKDYREVKTTFPLRQVITAAADGAIAACNAVKYVDSLNSVLVK